MKSCALALVALIATTSCSFLFEQETTQQTNESCTSVGRYYPRGDSQVDLARYDHIDYRQGTITFFARPLAEFSGAIPLMSVGGIGLAAAEDGLFLTYLASDGPPVWETEFIPLPTGTWSSDGKPEEVFVSLRWDTKHPLSGQADSMSHIEVRAGANVFYLQDGPFTVVPNMAAVDRGIVFGFGAGKFRVSKGVVYDRPLYVSPTFGDETALTEMAFRAGPGPLIADSGFDILFATAAPALADCDAATAEGWSLPDDLLGGNFKLADVTEPNTLVVMPHDEIYPGGGVRVDPGQDVTLTQMIAPEVSYTLEILAHGARPDPSDGPADGVVDINITLEGREVLNFQGQPATRENPRRSVLTFQSEAGEENATILLGALNGSVAYHSVMLYPNLLPEPGFEDEGLGWDKDFDDATQIEYMGTEIYAGQKSACITSPSSPSVLLQGPTGLSPTTTMRDNEFYLFGAQLHWFSGSEAPGALIGDGSLFATGAPYELTEKAGVVASKTDSWHGVAAVGRRLINDALDARHDLIRFGTASSVESSHFCVDSAFSFRLAPVEDGFVFYEDEAE